MARTLHLVKVNPAKRAIAMRAVKSAFMASGMPAEQALTSADSSVHAWLTKREPVGLIRTEDGGEIQGAVLAFSNAVGDTGAAEIAVDLAVDDPRTAPTLPQPTAERARVDAAFAAPLPADFVPTPESTRTALVLMAATNGNATGAHIYARQLALATGRVDDWLAVGRTLVDTFGFNQDPAS